MLGRFGKFTLVERIAEGGMAEVFKATVEGPQGFERVVAIKRLHRALCEDPDLTQMLVDEARIAVHLNHPNIGNVFDLGCIENQYFIIMEYIDGTDLQNLQNRARARNVKLRVPAALFALSETLSGLHYAHTTVGRNGEPLGIVHRDVSPQNIMITWDGRVKLVDFGIAKARNRAQTTQAGVIKGKYYYMAPEQAHGHRVDARSDVFAAGMVLYELLVGHSPYHELGDMELLRSVRMADFPAPSAYRSDLDPELSRLVEVATQRNPDRRFANAQDFQFALNDYRQRAFGAFAEPQIARLVATIANASGSGDNFPPMDRGAYRPSDESLLFDKPDDAALARASGGEAIGNGRKNNPFADDAPTEIYDADAQQGRGGQYAGSQSGGAPFGDQYSGGARNLPPAPGIGQGFGGPPPLDRGHQRPGGPVEQGFVPPHDPYQSPALQPGAMEANQRAAHSTKPSMVDRVAKPKYVYAAIAFATVLVLALAAILYVSGMSSDDPAEEGGADSAVVVEAEAPEKVAVPSKVPVAFNSTPPNAQIYVDEVERGTTPASVELEVGKTYEVELVRDGYEIARQTLTVTAEPEDVTTDLEQARGVLRILSYPPDAVIFIDDEEQGATPLTLTGLETDGSYKIIAKLGARTMERDVNWGDSGESLQDVMFEFSEGSAEAALNVKVEEPKSKASKSSSKRAYKRKSSRRRNRARPPRRKVDKSSDDEGLDVFGSASKSSEKSADDSDDSLDVFGGGSSSKKAPREEAKPAPKEEPAAKEEEEDLDIWGGKKEAAPKKKSQKKKQPKKAEPESDDDGLDIW